MNLQTTVAERLLTWLDVERLFKRRTALWTKLPIGVLGVTALLMAWRYVIPQRHCKSKSGWK